LIAIDSPMRATSGRKLSANWGVRTTRAGSRDGALGAGAGALGVPGALPSVENLLSSFLLVHFRMAHPLSLSRPLGSWPMSPSARADRSDPAHWCYGKTTDSNLSTTRLRPGGTNRPFECAGLPAREDFDSWVAHVCIGQPDGIEKGPTSLRDLLCLSRLDQELLVESFRS
jgi:hypothetical protein